VQIVLSELLSSLLLCIEIVLHFMVRELYLYSTVLCIIMEQLDADQLEQLKKCSTERLRLKLMHVGEEEDDVIGMDRPKLLEAVAKLMLLNVDDGQINADVRVCKPTDIRLRELELEERRLRLEESKTQAKLDESKTRLEESKTQAELKKEEMKMKMQLEIEIRKMEIDREFRLTKLRAQGVEVTGAVGESGADYFAVNPRWDDTLAGRTKKYGETLKHVLPSMPSSTYTVYGKYSRKQCVIWYW